jgi:L-lysine 2,3-aminomutase
LDCGEADPVVLEFDHVTGVKEAAVAELVQRAVSLARLIAEVEKCEVRCANCHRRRTARYRASQRPPGRIGERSSIYRAAPFPLRVLAQPPVPA